MAMSPNARAAAALLGMAAVGAGLYQIAMHVTLVGKPRAPTVTAVATTGAHDPRPDILLFTIDTMRADHVASQGYSRETTPRLDRLAAQGTRFSHAYSSSTWTVPALASLVTGVLPSEHGVRHGVRLGNRVASQEILSAELPSMAVALQGAGYRTVGVTSNVHLSEMLGFSRGFDAYECLEFVGIDELRPLVAARLAELRTGDAPFFLWVHVVEPHSPYVAVEPIFDSFRPTPAQRYPELERVEIAELLDAHIAQLGIPPDDGIAFAIAAYDSEIHAADAYLGELLDALSDDPRLAVVVAADHGEEFHDHLGLGHGHTAFDEVARVPLVVALPGATPSVVDETVSLIDVLPTVLDLASVSVPERAAGRTLLPATRGEIFEPRDVFLETGRGDIVIQAIVRGTTKYGREVEPVPLEGLFDLQNDPREMHDLMAERPELAATLRARLDEVLSAAAARRPPITTSTVEVSDQVRQQLEALGYEE